MQVGSGTHDMPINIAYTRVQNSFDWGESCLQKFALVKLIRSIA